MLRMKQSVYGEMMAHLQAVYPLEGCGLVGGLPGEATRCLPVANVLRSPTAYEMEPTAQIEAMILLEDAGLEITGIFHSHPAGPERPSPTDMAQAYYPDAAYIIVSLADRTQPVTRAFRLGNGRTTEISLLIE